MQVNEKMMKPFVVFLMLMLLSSACVSALVTVTDNFDDDTVGTNPTSPWYTYSEVADYGRVSDDYNRSAPNSFLHNGTFGKTSRFILDNATQPISLTFWIYLDSSIYLTTLQSFLLDSGSGSVALSAIPYGTQINFTSPGTVDLYAWFDEWVNVTFLFNWTNSTVLLCIANATSSSSSTWEDISPFLDLKEIRFGKFGDGLVYYDNLSFVYDDTPPVSSADPISPYWNASSPIAIMASAMSSHSSIASLSLYYRYSSDNITWGPWAWFSTIANATLLPWNFTFPSGPGHYGFYTIAIDAVGNVESAPAGPDAVCGLIAAPCSVIITYPEDGMTYNKNFWMSNHTLRFHAYDINSSVSCEILIKDGASFENRIYMTLTASGDYTLDLKPYVPFDNYVYFVNITLLDPWMRYAYHEHTWTLGLPAIAKSHHFSIEGFTPPHGDLNALSALNEGIHFNISTNFDDTTGGKGTVVVCITDYYQSYAGASPALRTYFWLRSVKLTSVYCVAWHSYQPGWVYPHFVDSTYWRYIELGTQTFKTRHIYKVYIGVFTDFNILNILNPGFNFHNTMQKIDPAGVEFDMLYDNSVISIGTWSIEPWESSLQGKFYPRVLENDKGSFDFYGVMADIGIYPPGETAQNSSGIYSQTGSTWGPNLMDAMEKQVPGISIVAGLICVGIFTLFPYMIAKRLRKRDVPTPVYMTCSVFGFIFAFSLGFFPLWLFIPPIIILSLVIFYKTLSWIKGARSKDDGSRPAESE